MQLGQLAEGRVLTVKRGHFQLLKLKNETETILFSTYRRTSYFCLLINTFLIVNVAMGLSSSSRGDLGAWSPPRKFGKLSISNWPKLTFLHEKCDKLMSFHRTFTSKDQGFKVLKDRAQKFFFLLQKGHFSPKGQGSGPS